jgi:hypothetical protein
VDQGNVDLDVEDLGGEVDLDGLDSHAQASCVFLAAERRTTRPFLGPGTAPLIRIRPLSADGSIETILSTLITLEVDNISQIINQRQNH